MGAGAAIVKEETLPRAKGILMALGNSAAKITASMERKGPVIIFSNTSPISNMLTECPKFWRV